MSTFAGNKQLEPTHREKKEIDGASQLPQQLVLERDKEEQSGAAKLATLHGTMGERLF